MVSWNILAKILSNKEHEFHKVVLFTQGTNEIWTTVHIVLLKHLVPLVSSINPVCCLSVFVRWFSNND